MISFRLPTLALLSALLTVTAFSEEVIDGLAAVVNSDPITFSDVRQLVMPREQAMRESLRGPELVDKIKDGRLDAINELIDRQLVLQEFEKNKFQVPDFVIDEQVNTIVRTQFNGDRQAFIRTLQAQGYTVQRFRKAERERFVVQQMRSRSVKVSPLVPPARIEQYYKQNIAQYSSPEQVKLRMIVVSKDSPDAKGTVEELRTKVKKGDDFGKLAAMYSEDASKESGGDWGWIDKGTLNDSLAKPAFALKAGEVSEVIELGERYYLLFAEQRKAGGAKPLSEVRADVTEKVLQVMRREAQEKWIAGLRAKAYIKIF